MSNEKKSVIMGKVNIANDELGANHTRVERVDILEMQFCVVNQGVDASEFDRVRT